MTPPSTPAVAGVIEDRIAASLNSLADEWEKRAAAKSDDFGNYDNGHKEGQADALYEAADELRSKLGEASG